MGCAKCQINFVRRAKEIIIAVVLHSVSGFVRVVLAVVQGKKTPRKAEVNSKLLDGALT